MELKWFIYSFSIKTYCIIAQKKMADEGEGQIFNFLFRLFHYLSKFYVNSDVWTQFDSEKVLVKRLWGTPQSFISL